MPVWLLKDINLWGWSYRGGDHINRHRSPGEGQRKERGKSPGSPTLNPFVASHSPGLALPGRQRARLHPMPAGTGWIPGLGMHKHVLSCGTPALTVPGDLQLLRE